MVNILHEVSLIYSNIGENSNKFYIMQVIEEDGKIDLIKRYGRLGKNPTIIKTNYVTLSRAITEFDKTYSSKLKKGYTLCSLEEIIYDDGNFKCRY